ncbi:MAG TPA: PD-(D/E)XK nuclease family protein [Candidatus Acidoferrales bacterium]|nr:PD-(D/E)XK nuclease family protein [Candidatus Acidoferrales bacterium]
MTFSHTQISQYLRCPRSYRYRYLDGWQEKETKASLLFGRCFEKALTAYFRREDSAAALFQEWGVYREAKLGYSKTDSWDRMARQGIHLLEMFARNDRIRIPDPGQNLQVKVARVLSDDNDFVAYIDALGYLDKTYCLIDWKTTTSKYPEDASLLALDPQLICYSWATGISEVALVVFVRKHTPEIQYLKTSISEQQRLEFGRLIESTASQIQAGQFLPHSGIRFPQNGCVGCAHLGLCLGNREMVDAKLVRKPGASELDWLDQFEG